MKKTYISPNMLVVRIGMTRPIAGSLNTGSATFNDEDAEFDGMARDNTVSDYNLWDKAW